MADPDATEGEYQGGHMTRASTQTLSEFLLARIAEDEAAAGNVTVFAVHPDTGMPGNRSIRERVLAECEAKRRIVGVVTDRLFDGVYTAELLSILALPYADHADYREEWRL